MPRRTVVDPRFTVRLKELRLERGLSLRELARQVPCAHVHIHGLESGRSNPSPELVARLDQVLDGGGGSWSRWSYQSRRTRARRQVGARRWPTRSLPG